MASPHTLLTDGTHDEHIAFWTSAIGSLIDDFHVRQPWLSTSYGEDTFDEACPLSPATAALVGELGKGQDLGVLAVVSGAIAAVLHAHTRAGVIAVDSPPLLGDGAGTDRAFVPLVMPVDPAMTVRDYLKQVGQNVASSYSFQDFPLGQFSDVVLKRPRPATNVAVSFDGLLGTVSGPISHDLRIAVARTPDTSIRLSGRAPAFSPAFLRILARHLAAVLEGFRNLDTRVGDIDLMGEEERTRLLVTYNSAAAAPNGRAIHTVFEEQAARAGSNVAVRLGDAEVTYDTLNQRANQLARFLQNEYGVGRGDVIGVIAHRSPATISALLGVLKAGAVYLPIDADYPEDRLKFLVADAGVKVLLVHSEHFDRLMSLYETPMFALDIQLETLETDAANLDTRCAPEDLAYIIYTSGSTGQPKGVLLEHGGFVTMARHHIDAFGVQPSDRLLQFYGLSFDSSLFEIFVSLLSGATLVMVDRDTINDPAALAAYVEAQQVTTLTLPPVYSSTLDPGKLGSVRRFVSAGDHCRVEDAQRLARTADYYNSYGPTETSVCVTHYKVDPERAYGSRIPIGRPIAGTSIYLLDERLQPVPEGIAGEIGVGGAGLARGYLHRDDLTAEKFVPSPFVPGERLYLTGDLGVWLPDGNLEVIGRRDNQVKIRGYRVELGEIESVLEQHPSVRETAVIAREDDLGNKRLAAYVSAAGTIDVEDLKAHLRARLPEFMIPPSFVVLERLPLTANGKIDRKALAAIAETSAAPAEAALPETPAQQTLAAIWEEVLGVARVGIHDNLFDLGGDSILIIQIVSRAREAGLKLAPNQLFDHQTIAELAEVAVAAQPAEAVEAEQHAIEGPAPLAPMQAWFFDQGFADAHHFNQSVCLEVPAGEFDAAAAEGAMRAILTHHDALRLRFTERDGQWTAEYAPAGTGAAFNVVDLSGVPADQQDAGIRAAVDEAQASFDLATGPLLVVRLLRLGSGRPSRLLFVAHHLVVDGVSWRILLGDFSTAYAQIVRGDELRLPAKTASFRTWTARLTEAASGLDAGYWLAPVSAAPLPTDLPRASDANTVASAREVTRTLDAETTTALLQDVPRAYTTEINDVLLAGLAIAFRGWTGNAGLLIDLEGHGRDELIDDVDTSRTVGWFTSQFPVLLRAGGDDAPGAVLKSIKEQLRAVPQRGAGFGVLRYLSRDAATVERLEARPAPEVLFNYFGQAGRVLAPELQWALAGPAGGDTSPRAARPHLLEINGMVESGRLTITWTFSEALHQRETMEALAGRYESALRLLVDQCRKMTTPAYTPSDFPAAGLDQKSLDALVAKLNR